jgi:hypothetical protein
VTAKVWELPGEPPGTLAEIFSAEDSRRNNLILYELRKVDAFGRCWEAIGAKGDGYALIWAIVTCINVHLRVPYGDAEFCRDLKETSRSAERVAAALEELKTTTERIGTAGFLAGLKEMGFPDITDPKLAKYLRQMATGLRELAARDAFKTSGGRPQMRAFRHLVDKLARLFEDATQRYPSLTHDENRPGGYGGRFWEFVEVVRPIVVEILERSGSQLSQPSTPGARGKFIEGVLKKYRTKKETSSPSR